MADFDPNDCSCLYTVGHSNHSSAEFIRLLMTRGIQVLVDVRSYPYSRYVSHFNREEIQPAVKQAGINYLFMGAELGGRPEGQEFYDDEGYVLYWRLAKSPTFVGAIDRLDAGIRQCRVAIMCSEENPSICHRHLLVGREMAKRGKRMLHIRGDGRLQTDEDLLPAHDPQPLLFDLPEENTWRSLRSVSRRRQLKNSSGSLSEMESSD